MTQIVKQKVKPLTLLLNALLLLTGDRLDEPSTIFSERAGLWQFQGLVGLFKSAVDKEIEPCFRKTPQWYFASSDFQFQFEKPDIMMNILLSLPTSYKTQDSPIGYGLEGCGVEVRVSIEERLFLRYIVHAGSGTHL
jgi:hypothetical protein